MIEFAIAGDSAQRETDIFRLLYVFLRPVAIDSEAVTDVREDQDSPQMSTTVLSSWVLKLAGCMEVHTKFHMEMNG